MATSQGSILSPELSNEATKANLSLENLPPELRIHVLSTLRLEQLSALIRASPVMYRDYRGSRRLILSNCLQTTLRAVTVDAFAACESSTDDFLNSWTRDRVVQFIQTYQSKRASSQNLEFTQTERLTEDEAVRMATLHSSVVQPLVHAYADWALTNLSEEAQKPRDNKALTRTEETRIFRAFYRFQLCCNLFGIGRPHALEDDRWAIDGFQSIEILKLFLIHFEPWEVEEIVCIYVFAKETIDHSLGPQSAEFEVYRDLYLAGTISRGLHLLQSVLETSDRGRRSSIIQDQLATLPGDFLEDDAWGTRAQTALRDEGHSLREQKQQREDWMYFFGDGDTETEGPRPSLAWVNAWDGTYSNVFGEYVKDVIQRWGYVMWDADRLKRTDALRLIYEHCDVENGNYDPRPRY